MNTHPPIELIQSVTLSLYIYFGWFMGWEVGGDGVIGGFIGWMGGGVGVEGFMGWWLEGSWGGWVYDGVGCGGLGCWRVHGVGAYTHPPMKSYNIKIFNFMTPTHQTYPVSLSLYIYFGGFMGWVVVGWLEGSWGGWLEGSWVGEYMHPPHPGVLGMMGGWAWV